MQTFRSLLLRRDVLSRLTISVVLAIGLWSWVTLSRDPETTRVFSDVVVEVTDFDEGLILVGEVPEVRTLITGAKSDTDPLSPSDARAGIDMSEISEPGTYTIKVEVTAPPDVWSARAEPARLSVQVEQRASITMPVVPVVTGDLGLNQQVGAVSPEHGEVVVSGPESSVERVRAVQLPIDIANRTSNFSGDFSPIAIDSGGQEVGGLTLNPDGISATVQITARGKQLAVVTQLTGAPESGFEIVDRAINPITALVDGPAETIDALITVSTLPVDVSGATSDVTERVRLADLPLGVIIIEPASGFVDVVVQIRPRGVQQALPEQPVTVINIGEGMLASVTPSTVTVYVEGSEQQLVDLGPGALQVVLDVSGLGAGTYTRQPRVVVPATLEWLSIVPDVVTVEISQVPRVVVGGTPVSGSATPSSDP